MNRQSHASSTTREGRISGLLLFVCSAAICLAWIGMDAAAIGLSPAMRTAAAGAAIFGAAFMLTWFAELAQKDIPQGLAIAFVAFVAVLPEYAVDMYYAWMAGQAAGYAQYAAANMTGANRLLIGMGWTLVLLFYGIRSGNPAVLIGVKRRVEMLALLMASLYAFVIPLVGTLTLMDTAVFLLIFIWYIRSTIVMGKGKGELDEHDIELFVGMNAWARRIVACMIFVAAGWTVWTASKPFAQGLLDMGHLFGIDRFILVQWVAPLASESPEFIVAIIFAWRFKPDIGLGALISSKVNQWTLLVGMLPLALCISSGSIQPLKLDARQTAEIALTAAQSLFALIVIMDLRFSWRAALLVFALFATQVFIPSTTVRYGYAVVYIVLVVVMLAKSRLLRSGVRHTTRLLWALPQESLSDMPQDRIGKIS